MRTTVKGGKEKGNLAGPFKPTSTQKGSRLQQRLLQTTVAGEI